MKWAEVSIKTSHEATELIAEIFHDLGASGVVIEDPELLNNYIHSGLWDYTDIPEAKNVEVVTVKAYLPVDDELDDKLLRFHQEVDALTARNVDGGPGDISCSEIQDEDWSENWKQYFHTEKPGSIIVIKPTCEAYEASPDDIVVEMDPGAAFGTGTHPTTSMCIRELEELVRGGYLGRTAIGLDFFDASINRVAAWVIGTRASQKALLTALLEPAAKLRAAEKSGNNALRLALFEESRALPLGAVWDEFCRRHDTPAGVDFMTEIAAYERDVLSKR